MHDNSVWMLVAAFLPLAITGWFANLGVLLDWFREPWAPPRLPRQHPAWVWATAAVPFLATMIVLGRERR